jgi:hypothetical protein
VFVVFVFFVKTDFKLVGDYVARSYAESQNLIRLADSKANIVIALLGVVFSLFFNFFVSKGVVSGFLIVVVIVPFVISGYFAFSAIFPRMGKSTKSNSLLFYSAANNIDSKKWMELFEKGYDRQIVEDYVQNTQALSMILERKFKHLRYAYVFLGVGLLVKLIVEFWAGYY